LFVPDAVQRASGAPLIPGPFEIRRLERSRVCSASLRAALRPGHAITITVSIMPDPFSFSLHNTDGAARRGEFTTPHGRVQTPAFMPVGTQATVKGLKPEDVRATGAEIVLGNTYHLMLRPGAERVAALGGLHKFMNWPHPILTDSGGFQVMSLSSLRKLEEKGVTFRSHLNGDMFELTPERAIEIQNLLGADIVMQLDECLKLPATPEEIERAMRLSLRWAERSKRAFESAPAGPALFGIVQGGDDLRLRVESARALTDIGFHGYAIGGLAVGEPQAVMLAMIAETAPALPGDRPRYLMGIGTPEDILEAVACGIDMFDCVMPTRNGRHGVAFSRYGAITLKNARHAEDARPLDEQSAFAPARDYSRAYLHHLVKANEMLGAMLLSAINLVYYQELMSGIRAAIASGQFEEFRQATKEGWARGDIPTRD
jgi:queuine tRNA-ribosyltransferase